MYYTVIKHSSHLRTLEKCRKHSPAARVFYISLVFSNACRDLSQCNTRLRLLYLLNETKWTPFEVRTHPTFLETLISKSDFGPVKPFLPGLSRNGPQDWFVKMPLNSWHIMGVSNGLLFPLRSFPYISHRL